MQTPCGLFNGLSASSTYILQQTPHFQVTTVFNLKRGHCRVNPKNVAIVLNLSTLISCQRLSRNLVSGLGSVMFSRASLTIRVSGIDPGAFTTDTFGQKFQELHDVDSKPKWAPFWKRDKTRDLPLLASVAHHGDSDMGTVTMSSEESKARALKKLNAAEWVVDDTFANLTVLYSAPEPDLEYVFPQPQLDQI
jgi:hypothetical protein